MIIGVNVGHYQELPDMTKQMGMLNGIPIIRFMDWQQVNLFQDSYKFPTKSDDLFFSDWAYSGGAWHKWRGVPVNVLVETVNQLDARGWFCVHHTINDSYSLVNYLVKNCKHRPIIEFSNEVWNSVFLQSRIGVSFERTLEVCATETHNLAKYAKGKADIVLCGQATNSWVIKKMLESMPYPNGLKAIAIAPYWKNETELWQCQENINGHMAIANSFGLELWGYEGGQHIIGSSSPEENRSVRMGLLYKAYLSILKDSGVKLCTLYSIASSFNSSCFGLYEVAKGEVIRHPKTVF